MSTILSDITTLIDDRRRDDTVNSITAEQRMRAVNSALDIWNTLHDWPWTIKGVNFNYNQGIDTYEMPVDDFKFDITIKPSKGSKVKEFWKVSENKFESAVTKVFRYSIANNEGKQYIRIKGAMGNRMTLNTATKYDENGTWVGAGAISDVTNDNYEGYEYPTSVAFLYEGTSGTLTNSTFNAIQAEMYKNRSNLYFRVEIPEITDLTSFSLKWGSSASDYYTATVTTDYVGEPFKVGWNTIRIPWANPTQVGTPDDLAISYLQVTIAYANDPGEVMFRIQDFFVSENVPITFRYYSNNMVYDVSGSTQMQKFNDVTATTDYPLWSGQWDAVTEQFVNSVLEIVFWMTGEYSDMEVARTKIQQIVEPLKARYPTQRRQTTFFITTDTNLMADGRRDNYLRRYGQ